MAEATGLRNNALPYPVYGVPYGLVFPLLDADGDLVTGATTPDSEVSKNGDTFADCTNEMVEIATASGMYYLLLTGTEMTADVVAIICKSATAGMKTTPIVLYPAKLVTLRAGTSQAGAAGTITLDASASAVDDFYNGCLIVAVIDSNTEARIITDYVGSTKVASVTPNWNVTPDADDTFTIYLPWGRQITDANPTAINGDPISAANLAKSTRFGRGTVTTGGTTTSIPTSAFAPAGAAANQFTGRIITFDVDTATAALRGQATDITASTNAATPTFTVTALTTAPASGDTFSVT